MAPCTHTSARSVRAGKLHGETAPPSQPDPPVEPGKASPALRWLASLSPQPPELAKNGIGMLEHA